MSDSTPHVDIVCTDNGQHKRRLLDRLWWVRDDDGRMRVGITVTAMRRWHDVDESELPLDRNPSVRAGRETPIVLAREFTPTQAFKCESCGRAPRWTSSRIEQIVEACIAGGLSEFDISHA